MKLLSLVLYALTAMIGIAALPAEPQYVLSTHPFTIDSEADQISRPAGVVAARAPQTSEEPYVDPGEEDDGFINFNDD